MKKYLIFLVVLSGLFSACSSDIIYSHFYPIKSGEWSIDSTLRFEVPIVDITTNYRTILYVRHTERYPYQNMWLFVGDSIHRDTIEFYLADDRGQWLGNHHNGLIEMPVLLDEERHFADTEVFVLEVQHGMRDSLLRGVMDVGIEVYKNGQK